MQTMGMFLPVPLLNTNPGPASRAATTNKAETSNTTKLTQPSLAIHDSAPVTIGDRCHIAPNVTIITESHGVDVAPRRAGLLYARPVSIGDDCWIGTNVVILPGVTIGKGCTIGSCAVVSKNIPDFSVAAGVPARVIKKLEDPDALVNGFEE